MGFQFSLGRYSHGRYTWHLNLCLLQGGLSYPFFCGLHGAEDEKRVLGHVLKEF